MHILLINQFFWPDLAATSQLSTDLCRGLRERGYEVTVIAADSRYQSASSDTQPPDVKVIRTPTFAFVRGPAGRLLSYFSFWVCAFVVGFTVRRPDIVVTLTTPPLISLVGTFLKLFRGLKHWIWEMDMYPDVAVDLGVVKSGSLIDRLVGAAADFSRSRADGVIALGQCMKDRLLRRGLAENKIYIAENWADGTIYHPASAPKATSELNIIYAGNLGMAHDLDTLCASLTSFNANVQFSFIGGGAHIKTLRAFCERAKLTSVSFQPYQSPRQLVAGAFQKAHIGLVTQIASCVGTVVPSKVYSLLGAGLPILFIGPSDATPARIIAQLGCGWHIECGDVAGLKALINRLHADHTAIEAAAGRARSAFCKHYDRPIGVARICKLLEEAEKSGRTTPVPVPDPTAC